MPFSGRACPNCGSLMVWMPFSTRGVEISPGVVKRLDAGEICPNCSFEIPIHIHRFSNEVALSQRLIWQGKYERARRILLSVWRENPTLDIAFCLAKLYIEIKRPEEAKMWFERGMKLFKHWPKDDISTLQDFLIDFGYLLGFVMDKKRKAIKLFKKAISLYKENYKAWYNLGSLYARQRKWRRAEKCYRKALEIHPGHEESQRALQAVEASKKQD